MLQKRKFIILITLLLLVTVYYIVYQNNYKEKTGGSYPVITFDSKVVETTIAEADVNILKGVTAYDTEDGDVTDSILVESISKFTSPGRSIVTYVAFDSSNHISSATRELVYTDYEAPKISLHAPLRYVYSSSLNITKDISAYDSIDGDVSDRIKYSFVDGNDNLAQVGKHPVVLTVSNSRGDVTSLEVAVEIYTETYLEKLNTPQIHLNEYLIYVEKGEQVDFDSYIKYIMLGDETLRASELANTGLTVEIDKNDFDVTVPGVYSVTYSMETPSGYRGLTDLVVVVEE